MDENQKNLAMDELVDNPVIDRLGLKEEHFYGAVVQANDKLSKGDVEGAFQDYCKLVLISPESTTFQLGLAQTAIATGMLDLGLQAASAVVMMQPDKPEGYFQSGRACFMMKEFGLAAEDLKEALDKCSGDARYNDLAKSARALLLKAEDA